MRSYELTCNVFYSFLVDPLQVPRISKSMPDKMSSSLGLKIFFHLIKMRFDNRTLIKRPTCNDLLEYDAEIDEVWILHSNQ